MFSWENIQPLIPTLRMNQGGNSAANVANPGVLPGVNLEPRSNPVPNVANWGGLQGANLAKLDGIPSINRGNNPGQGSGLKGSRGGNQGNRGGHQGNKEGNQRSKGGAQGNEGGNQGNKSGNQGNKNVNQGNRGGNQGIRGGHQGKKGTNQANRGGRGGNYSNRGGGRGENARPEMPQMDWFNLRARDQSEDRRSQHSVGNTPLRRDYGGRYGSTSSLDNHRGESKRGGPTNRGRNKSGPYLGFKLLEELSKMEPDNLVVTLTNKNSGLDKLIQTDLSNDFIVLILRVLTQMCESSFQENKATVFATVCNKNFLDQLTIYLSDICTHERIDKMKNKYFWNEQEKFWNDLLNFYENVLRIIPNTGCELLPKIVKKTLIAVHNFESEQKSAVPDEVKDRLEALQIKIIMSVEEREQKQNKLAAQVEAEPPDNYRQISLYPTAHEITNRDKPFIRKNIVEGRYGSVEHYLDVQFRLLREDFVAPLREGICDFLQQIKSNERKRIFNIRFYTNVYFVRKETIKDKVAWVVQLSLKKKIQLENTRKFMFGSLVCLSKDNFKSIIFGTIADRDKKLLECNQIAIDVVDNAVTNDPYIMVECSVYFEPYYHVLKALQIMSEDKFPLKRYIINVEPEVNPPSYYTFHTEVEHSRFKFIPLIPDSWPSHKQLGLDPSQFRAFKAALTKEFCVIQGPPGTGKTFIGLKVAEVLLENMEVWNTNKCPILVICFTNHALDQFLEGILNFTKKLVRIGGQSKSEKLKGHNIRDIRTSIIRSTRNNRESAQLMYKKRAELKECMDRIRSHQTLLSEISQGSLIFNFKKFEVIDKKIKDSWFDKVKSKDLLDWLMGGRNPDERYEERRRNRLAQMRNQIEQEEEENADSDSEDEFFEADEEEQGVDDREDIVIKTESINMSTFSIMTVATLISRIELLERDLATIEAKAEEVNDFVVYDERGKKEQELHKARDEFEYFKWRMDQFKANNPPPHPLIVDYNRPEILTPNERWGLYFHWLTQYRIQLSADLTVLDENYRRVYRQYEEVRQIEDTQIMKEMLVVGMTTSGAARYQSLLQALKCPIVIVEEAAEVLESHVVVSLTNDCKHLILIGDHQQLRPTTAVYRLAKDYKLDISLFERMVNNKIHCEQLEVQHRMRPEIARLIVPSIYPKLENYHNVESYPPIHGITKNLFFITHTEKEEAVADTGSKRNVHEAKLLIKLARHLVLQGYEQSEITILATYSGQLFCLRKEKKNFFNLLKDVRISVVDNFQGEENKIILLSLVRSNEEDNVGFLKTDNRVCVALSRAKEGMYIIGNMNILEKSSAVWRQIKNVLEQNDQFGTHLTLQCQVHPNQLTRVATAEDFNKVTEGGCSQLCNKQLNCGHICSSTCHIIDREHEYYKCKERCTKVLCELDHQCPDLCFKPCLPCQVLLPVTLKCGHTHPLPCHMNDTSKYKCPTIVPVDLDCGHKADKPCHIDKNVFPCPHPCEIRMLCGHACTRKCHVNNDPDHLKMRCFKPCERIKKECCLNKHKCMLRCFEDCQICEVKVKKTRSCGHIHDVACNANVEEIECNRRCKKTLPCGHNCKQNCSETCGNCVEKVTKTIPECNHLMKMKCFETPDRKKCNKECPLELPCGHPCNKRCNEPCQNKCKFLVDSPHKTACNHQFQIPCYKTKQSFEATSFELLQHCSAPCGAQLLCEHKCSGTCGSCAQGRVHASCQEKCGRTLVCGHPCDIPCREMCQPCDKRCSYRCGHNKCGLKCGEPCKPCLERCLRKCEHIACSKLCCQPCDVEPCMEPCPKLLKCKHPCIGFCGDPCPPVCRICDPENETFELLFGNEDEPDARFVYLSECKHIIEATAMDQWLDQTLQDAPKEINLKHCPKCKTTLAFTQRYSGFIKEAYADINKVKQKWFGQESKNEESRMLLQLRIEEVKNINKMLYSHSDLFQSVLHDLRNLLKEKYKGKRNPLNIITVMSCRSEIELIESLVNVFNKGKFKEAQEQFGICLKRFDFILKLLTKKDGSISKQKATDIELEINKFERLVQLCTIEKNPKFNTACSKSEIKDLYSTIKNVLNSNERYSENDDKSLKTNLGKLADAVDKSMVVTDEERKSVVKAMQEGRDAVGKGRWFKCPKGHFFLIGECGGAMELAKCFECGSTIGGQNHALLPSNTFAGEMDGAARPAWSNAANLDLRNFHLD